MNFIYEPRHVCMSRNVIRQMIEMCHVYQELEPIIRTQHKIGSDKI